MSKLSNTFNITAHCTVTERHDKSKMAPVRG